MLSRRALEVQARDLDVVRGLPLEFLIALDVDSVETLALDDRMRDRLDEAWPLADHRVPASRF